MKLRNVNSQLENERQKLKEELTRCESRSARLEIQRIALEGDLNRLQMILQEKDIHIQVNQLIVSFVCICVLDPQNKHTKISLQICSPLQLENINQFLIFNRNCKIVWNLRRELLLILKKNVILYNHR